MRQGCPLSPVIYLFVGWALHCWLVSRPQLGLQLAGARHVGVQFADDTEALLGGWDEPHVQPLVESMSVFEGASGQGLNLGKCLIVPVGAVPPGALPDRVCGIRVVEHATALGMVFANDDVDRTDWPAIMAG